MATETRPPQLSALYFRYQAQFYGPILEQMERDGLIGPGGITEEQVAALPPCMGVEEFIESLERSHVEFRY